MNALKRISTCVLAGILGVIVEPLHGLAQQNSEASKNILQPTERDGQHDFDFEIGDWKTHLRRLVHPLTGSTTWVEYEGTSVVRKVWNGRANLVELVADGAAGHFEGLNLRLYNPESHQWSLNFANSNGGTLSQPTIGRIQEWTRRVFRPGNTERPGHFCSICYLGHHPSCRFEQAFSDDGGKTWEVNWIATDTRVKDESDEAHCTPWQTKPGIARLGYDQTAA